MNYDFFQEHSILLNPARLGSVLIFLCGFVLSIYIWFAIHSKTWNPHLFLSSLIQNRKEMVKQLFSEGPGYLILPLWLILATMLENYLPLLLPDIFQ